MGKKTNKIELKTHVDLLSGCPSSFFLFAAFDTVRTVAMFAEATIK
jgi:hypothetical protein